MNSSVVAAVAVVVVEVLLDYHMHMADFVLSNITLRDSDPPHILSQVTYQMTPSIVIKINKIVHLVNITVNSENSECIAGTSCSQS